MYLKSLKLKNIRSYVDTELEFPDNYVLLSGDIGSGKSTVLLAIEFALFGLLRGELSGHALLRNGRHEGIVELSFNLDQKDIIIKRSLKRNGDSVSQNSGSITMNGVTKSMTAQELKATILQLFGYPSSMVTKSKLVYRYTVYTPQEEMKAVLFDKPEERLNVLRQVFDIDKYKTIKENATIVLRTLRGDARELEGRTADIKEKKAILREHEKDLEITDKELKSAEQHRKQSSEALQKMQEKVNELENKAKQATQAKTKYVLAEKTIEHARQRRAQLLKEQESLQEEIEQAKVMLTPIDISALPQKNEELRMLSERIYRISQQVGEAEAKKRLCEKTIQQITELDTCPTCRQLVTKDHKHAVEAHQKKEIEHVARTVQNLQQEKEIISTKAEEVRKDVAKLQALEERAKAQTRVKESMERMQRRKLEIVEDLQNIVERIEKAKQEQALHKEIMKQTISFDKEKEELEVLRQQHRDRDIACEKLQERKSMLTRQIEQEKNEVGEKEKLFKKLKKLEAEISWLKNEFLPLMDIMERHIMQNLHTQFNQLFQRWFSVLIEDMLQARVDESFTPIIIQNGYEVDIQHLSGGEKTACALAYRLALNRVINDVIDTIRTKDLLVLDEPTDGFSNQQLERLGQVLNDLEARQVIVVSHEQAMESYVDSVIGLRKENHVTEIMR